MNPAQAGTPRLEILASRHFPDWLAQHHISLAVSTYQVGKLLLIGVGPDGRLSVFERTFDRCMGLWSDGQTLWLASAFQLWRLENVLPDGDSDDGYDRLYIPRAGFTTGDIDVHDVTVANGRVVFVSTLFSCLATLSERHNFEPLWRPPFVSRLAAEDRCHLNGLAMGGDEPRYVTACGPSDIADGWRDHRRSGGRVVDVRANRVVVDQLSMPHSPRLRENRLWLLDSGRGYLGHVDPSAGKFERVAFCPGYARGLTFHGQFAIIGLSKPRNKTFSGLDLDDELSKKGAEARCGLQVVDLNSGDVVHWLRFEGAVAELYDVVVLPGVRRPRALGFKTEEIRRNVWIIADGQPHRWIGQTAPDTAEANCKLAQRHQRQGHPREALACFQKALSLDPQHVSSLIGRELVRAEVCDWSERAAGIDRVRKLIAARLARGEPSPMGATPIAVFPFSGPEQLAIARSVADTLDRQIASVLKQLNFTHRPAGPRLRLGYLSADFRNHATGHLMQSVFALHDRQGFEVFAYSFGPDDGSDYRRRIESGCDHFVDITSLTAVDAARRIHADGIDILIDLMGHAGNARPDILALRPAPIQVHYLGYPGSTGASFVDYFLADRVVIPAENVGHFREQIVWLPHCYQCNDHQQPIAERPVSRVEENLPAEGFVFCCFNSAWKIDPDIFAVWIRILTQVPGSVLWLLGESELVRSNLRREATARGVDAARLVFAEVRPKPEHLARHRLADLFLDTSLCNAHTTASDALWVGVPLLTCVGATFASRVATSLLTTLGLPELIVADLVEYERRAVQLATNAEHLHDLRQRLETNRQSGPLFDTPRFVHNLERAFRSLSPRSPQSNPGPPLLIDEQDH